MGDRGIAMIDEIQGPPRWEGPDVLLRQTSFRALAEPRRFRRPDGGVTTGSLRVRFGEVEARGIALTQVGRALYDELIAETDRRLADHPGASGQDLARDIWRARFPHDERQLAAEKMAYFTYQPATRRPRDGQRPPADLPGLLEGAGSPPTPSSTRTSCPARPLGSSNPTSPTRAPGTPPGAGPTTTRAGSPRPSSALSTTPSTSTRRSRTTPCAWPAGHSGCPPRPTADPRRIPARSPTAARRRTGDRPTARA